jgi:quercetin dioxygenase-like cupin family protein
MSAQQDEETAVAAATVLDRDPQSCCDLQPAAPVSYFEKATVAAAFQRGAPLIEVEGYKVHASRRDRPGQAEVHEHETDVIYVLEGTATFVTGGKVVGGQVTAEHEIRGSAIEGGERRQIQKGDVLVVPAGTPHWFAEVSGTLLYYVVKVIS